MAISVSRLRSAGLAKESVLGTPVITPTRYLNIIPPDGFTPMIEPLSSKGIQAIRDMHPKISQGPGTLNGMKLKFEAEPENMGEILEAVFGGDTFTEQASFVIGSSNHSIDFKENGGSQLHATIASATYAAGLTSATNGSLCKAIKTALEAAPSATLTYTVAYSYSTKKFTITASSTTVQFLWLTGTNQATGAYSALGFSHADTSATLAVTSDSTTQVPAFSHIFAPTQVSQLPTLTWWFDKYLKFPLFAGAMCNKFDIDVKAKGIVEVDTEWVGITYDDTDGISESTTFSSLKPFVWANAVVNVDGSPVSGYDNLKITISNMVKADHALNNSIWPYVNYTEGLDVSISAELFFENTTQYQKFLNASTAHFQVVITSGQLIGGATAYSLTLDLPIVFYKSANLYIPSNGPLKVQFQGLAQPSGYSIQATLINSVNATY